MKRTLAFAAALILLAVGVGVVRSADPGLELPQLPKPATPAVLGEPTDLDPPATADAPAWNDGPQDPRAAATAIPRRAPVNSNGAPEHTQRQFLKVAAVFAQSADEPDVRKVLNDMAAKLAERDADSKIRQAEEILKGLIQEFPQTDAAKRAQQMLEPASGPNSPNNKFKKSTDQPAPDAPDIVPQGA